MEASSDKSKDATQKQASAGFGGCVGIKSGNSSKEYTGEESLTDKQKLVLSLYRKHKSIAAASTEYGCRLDTFRNSLLVVRKALGKSDVRDLLSDDRIEESSITASALLELIKKQEYRCAISGVLLSPSDASLDHKIPVSDGGTHDIENVQWVSAEVNRAKNTMSNEAFIQLCQRVTQWIR